MKKLGILLCFLIIGKVYSQCLPPTGITITNITSSGASVSFSAAAGASSYSWNVFTTYPTHIEANPGGNTTIRSFNFSGLQPSKSYRFQVVTICGVSISAPDSVIFTTPANEISYTPMTAAGYQFKYLKADSGLTVPNLDTNLLRGTTRPGSLVYKNGAGFYGWNGTAWTSLAGGGGGSTDSSIFQTKFRSDTARINTYSAIAGKLAIADTTNTWISSVSQPNDSSLTFVKGSTATNYIIRAATAGSATRLVTTVYNNTGSTIPKGSVVYINGRHSSNLPTIALAQANDEANSYKTFALVENDIATSNSGIAIQAGNIGNLNLPTSTYTDGDIVYLSPTVAGGITITKPLAPYHICKLGSITRAHPTFGSIEIKIENGWQLDEMSDVQIAAVPDDSTILQFSRVDSLWKAVSPTNVINGYAWKTSGNSDVNAGRYLGSSNNASVRIKTNNTERMVIDSIGSISIGSSLANASSVLDITSNKGILIPRVSTSTRDAISSPASQLLVSNTTKKTLDQYNGTSWNSIAGDFNKDLLGLQTLGSPIKSSPIGSQLMPSTGGSLTASRSFFSAIIVDKEITITGAMWYQSVQGVYIGTGGNYNGIALYSQNGGTLTLIDSTVRDTTIWKAPSASWNQKAFAGGSRTLQPGVYYLLALANTNNGTFTTAPVLGLWQSINTSNSMTTNSAKLYGGVINTVSLPPTSQAMSSWNVFNFYFSLYLY